VFKGLCWVRVQVLARRRLRQPLQASKLCVSLAGWFGLCLSLIVGHLASLTSQPEAASLLTSGVEGCRYPPLHTLSHQRCRLRLERWHARCAVCVSQLACVREAAPMSSCLVALVSASAAALCASRDHANLHHEPSECIECVRVAAQTAYWLLRRVCVRACGGCYCC
jgi:hypothetical protein